MARSKQTFNKRENEKKREKKRQEKKEKKENRKANSGGGGLDSMIAYVDENGMITDVPPSQQRKRNEIDPNSIVLGVPQKSDEPEYYTGRVSYFNTEKGYGFINELEGKEKYFFHINGLLEQVVEKDKVTFDLEKGQKGLIAVNIKKI